MECNQSGGMITLRRRSYNWCMMLTPCRAKASTRDCSTSYMIASCDLRPVAYGTAMVRDLENLNHPWGGVEGPKAPPHLPRVGVRGRAQPAPRTPTLGCFEISESLKRSSNKGDHS